MQGLFVSKKSSEAKQQELHSFPTTACSHPSVLSMTVSAWLKGGDVYQGLCTEGDPLGVISGGGGDDPPLQLLRAQGRHLVVRPPQLEREHLQAGQRNLKLRITYLSHCQNLAMLQETCVALLQGNSYLPCIIRGMMCRCTIPLLYYRLIRKKYASDQHTGRLRF